jgi:hypothetical protein
MNEVKRLAPDRALQHRVGATYRSNDYDIEWETSGSSLCVDVTS